MSNIVSFSLHGWEDYTYWQIEDKNTLKKINNLIKNILRNRYFGLGKPEPLKENLSGYWSREINKKNRLVYRVNDDGIIEIIQCRGHYSDN